MRRGWRRLAPLRPQLLAAADSFSAAADGMATRRSVAVGRSPACSTEEKQGRPLWTQRRSGEPVRTSAAADSSFSPWSAGLRSCQGQGPFHKGGGGERERERERESTSLTGIVV